MTEQGKKNWLYGVVAFLLLALVIETGFLISQTVLDKSKGEEHLAMPLIQHERYLSPTSGPFTAFSRRPSDGDDWDPFEEMQRMQEQMNRIFEESFGRVSRTSGLFAPAVGFSHSLRLPSSSPAIDLEETEDAYLAKADLPGLEKDKIQVRVSGNVLTIQGERKVESEKENAEGSFFSAERSYGSFARSMTLPGLVDESGVTADYQNGVLTVTLPKLEEAASQEKTIPIN